MAILSGQSTNLVLCLFSILLVKNTHISILNIKTNKFSNVSIFVWPKYTISAIRLVVSGAIIAMFMAIKVMCFEKLFVLMFKMLICVFLTKRIENKQKTKFVLWPDKIAIWRHCKELWKILLGQFSLLYKVAILLKLLKWYVFKYI